MQADEAYNIGPAASQLSYLNKQKILQVAKASGAQVSLVVWGGGKRQEGAYNIGPVASQLSYLNKQKILQVAKASGAQVSLVVWGWGGGVRDRRGHTT